MHFCFDSASAKHFKVSDAVTIDQINLTREVQVLHRQFFLREAPHGLIESYLRFHMESPDMIGASDIELRTMQIIIEKDLDALGIEPWLRSGSKRHLLSRKLLLTAYLAECDASHPEFRQEVYGRGRSLAHVCRSTALATYHLLKGWLQITIYELL
jgi:hypothetical protein